MSATERASPTRLPTSSATPSQEAGAKPQRVLACVPCQQRKVKCDRRFPCANCVRAGNALQCVPASLVPRQRRRRFPERELLERLRSYESLLRRHNIDFEPLHGPPVGTSSPSEDGAAYNSGSRHVSGADLPTSSARDTDNVTIKSEPGQAGQTGHEAKNIWHLMNRMKSSDPEANDPCGDGADDSDASSENDGVSEAMVRRAWDKVYQGNNQSLLFGLRKADTNLFSLHPEQVTIFRLWQIYLENVNPLLKVTHTPTLQARIIDAAADVSKITPTLEALMFSIYCVSVASLTESECRTLFASSRDIVLKSYQTGCQQALLNCGFLRSSDRDCLTAFFLYLVSTGSTTDPRSLSSMFSVAIRLAQRMGIHNESTYAKYNVFEAEMCRRLWWALVILDNRICEMSDSKATNLVPTWDCKTPLNVNDFDIQPEMKVSPAIHDRPTEALFAVVRSELSELVRHSTLHLDFTCPSLKAISQSARRSLGLEGDELLAIEKSMESRYLELCNLENPLHFLTIWATRAHLAKTRLLEYYSKSSSSQPTDAQRDAAISYALSMLECDTKLMNSPFLKGYLWLLSFYFPFPAYAHLVHDLRRRPFQQQSDRLWKVMSDNYRARFGTTDSDDPFLEFFARIVLHAWEAREAELTTVNAADVPYIVSIIRQKTLHLKAQKLKIEQSRGPPGVNTGMFPPVQMPMDSDPQALAYDMDGQHFIQPDYAGLAGQFQMDMDMEMNQADWNMMNWYPMPPRGW